MYKHGIGHVGHVVSTQQDSSQACHLFTHGHVAKLCSLKRLTNIYASFQAWELDIGQMFMSECVRVRSISHCSQVQSL